MSASEEQLHPRILSQRSARTLYNAADAWGVRDSERLQQLGRAVRQSLRHQGVGAARKTWAALAWLEWRAVAISPPGRGFSRRPQGQRRALLARSAASWDGWAVAWIRGLMTEAVGELDA